MKEVDEFLKLSDEALSYHKKFNKFFGRCVDAQTTVKNRAKLIFMYDKLNSLRQQAGIEKLELYSIENLRDEEYVKLLSI